MGLQQFDQLLRVYLNKPTPTNWERLARRIIPGTHRTVWQAWARVDGRAPLRVVARAIDEPELTARKKWPNIPKPFTVRRAVRAARQGKVPVGWWWLDEPRPPKVPR